MKRDNIRNIAIIAHVDHGKTTLVDAMLKQTHTVKDDGGALLMDSGDLERERGITIRAKNASLEYGGIKINIVDTPGHADFGGEVERTLRMADGVLLLVDAKEGPMPQTKFVLKKALELGHRAIVVINKIDKPDAQIDHTINKTFDLFVHLGATDEQLEFPIIYASGIRGLASTDPEKLKTLIQNPSQEPDIKDLFEAVVKYIPAPEVKSEEAFAMLVLAIAYDNYIGKIGIGKITAGSVKKGQQLAQFKHDGSKSISKVTALQMYQGMKPVDAVEASAGDIVAIAGFDNIQIGETLADAQTGVQIPPVHVEPPTVKMTFGVNTSPFAGKEGKLVTSRNIRDRLYKELETNVALKVEDTDKGDEFLVSGRGELHLAVLIETMRREGFELQVSQPQVIFHEENGQKMEPYEQVTIDVPSEYQGTIIEEIGRRAGTMSSMDSAPNGDVHLEYTMPTRGLIGLKNLLLTRTRGTAIINNLFDSYEPVHDIDTHANDHGSLIASESGVSNAYGLNNAQERGVMFIGPAVEVYEGMVIGQNALNSDIEVNVCKTKKLTNMRSSGADDAIILVPPRPIELDFAMEYIGPDELVEVTPLSIRIRKRLLNANDRKRAGR
ncbi:MAG: translational GTPase TypA [Candidatus Doudnabacteria bacterium]|nr:translational GTPase TypA [Candidatus Doudnabacteria bacterium]